MRRSTLVLLGLFVAMTTTARGQSLSARYVPEPIPLARLLVWIDDRAPKPLSDAQRDAIETAHAIRARPTPVSIDDHVGWECVLGRWEFELAERNMRGILALRRELTDEERSRIPGVDDYEHVCMRLGTRYWSD
jgi:hypothetical protein